MKVKDLKKRLDEQNPESEVAPKMGCFHGKTTIYVENKEHCLEDKIEL